MNEAGELFSFLSRLASFREVVAKDIGAEKSVIHLDVINNKLTGLKLFQGLDEKAREIILSINKPEFAKCPPLPPSLDGWFNEDYQDYHNEDVKPINRRIFETETGSITRIFLDSDRRSREFAEWKKSRILWRHGEREKETLRRLYDEFYRIYEKIKRDENLELYIGNCHFYNGLTEGVHYPLMLRRVEIRYRDDFMEIIDAAEDTIFSEEIFAGMEGFTEDRLIRARKEIRRAKVHPAQSNLGNRLFKRIAEILSPNCRFSPDGLNIMPTDWFVMYEGPILFIRKKRSKAKFFIEKLCKFYEKNNELPLPLTDFFNPKRQGAANVNNIVLPKQASWAQKKVLGAIISNALVTVDAPPGTGKTHSVSNFLTHFLAEGKRVLVTGNNKRALNAFVENLPEKLRLITVSYKKNEHLEIEKAIVAEAAQIEGQDVHTLREREEELKKQRKNFLSNISEFRRKLKSIERNERKTNAFRFEGKDYSLSEMAKYLSENENLLHLIPGRVKEGESFPLTEEELAMLYETNAFFTPQILTEMTEPLPKSEKLLSPFEFENLLKTRKRLMDKERGLLMELPDFSIDGEKVLYRGEAVAEFINRDYFEAAQRAYLALDFKWLDNAWAREAVLAGRIGGETKEAYLELKRAAEDVKSARDNATLLLLGNRVQISDDLVHDARVIGDLEKIGELFKEHGGIPVIQRIFNKRFKNILEKITINNYPITSSLDVETAMMSLTLRRARVRLDAIWQELMVTQGEKPYTELSKDLNDADEIVATRVREIEYAINWYDKKRGEFIALLNEAGINTDKIIPAHDPFTTPRQQLASEIGWLVTTYPSFSELLKLVAIEKNEFQKVMDKHKEALINRSSSLAKRMLFALATNNAENYKREYELLLRYESLIDKYEKRSDLLSRLAKVAPDYAALIATQKGGGAVTEKPINVLKAYMARQFSSELEKCEELSFTSETEENFSLNSELLQDVIFEKFLERIEDNGQKGSIMRLAKAITESSDDKRRNKLNAAEREMFMGNCPLWVLSIEDVFEVIDNEKFDAVFIDGADTLDSFSLALLTLGDKVVLFGDRRAPVNFQFDFSEEILPPNDSKKGFYKSLFNTSMYELVRIATEPYHLREEFRSPQVLSNIMSKTAYDKELKPMRLVDDEEFIPIVRHETAGTVDPLRPVNFIEAEEVVLLISACLKESEYQNKSFGVITLSGNDEAEIIFEIAMRRLSPETLEKINFISGVISDFVGIERDIVFLPLVDDEETSVYEPRPYDISFAVSRAREQLFVVHSKKAFRDSRRFLLEPIIGRKEQKQRAKTALGREIAQSLVEYGFDARESFRLGDMTLEIAVFGDGKAVIVPISDEPTEKIDEEFLSKQDFQILYVRGSKFYKNPQKTLESLIKALVENDIGKKERRENFGKDLLDRVYKNVSALRDEYRRHEGNGR